MRRCSTLLTRLALASLAVLGFVAPLATPEADRVVQTVGGRATSAQPREAELPAVKRLAPRQRVPALGVTLRVHRAVEGGRRYLLHRAWLI